MRRAGADSCPTRTRTKRVRQIFVQLRDVLQSGRHLPRARMTYTLRLILQQFFRHPESGLATQSHRDRSTRASVAVLACRSPTILRRACARQWMRAPREGRAHRQRQEEGARVERTARCRDAAPTGRALGVSHAAGLPDVVKASVRFDSAKRSGAPTGLTRRTTAGRASRSPRKGAWKSCGGQSLKSHLR